jgi:hypothetical protein
MATEKDVYSARAMTSVSATVSSLTGILANDILASVFPKGFFKKFKPGTINIGSAGAEDEDGVHHSALPYLAIDPRYEELPDPLFDPSPQANWKSSFLSAPFGRHYQKVLDDPINGRFIYAIGKRMRVNFEVTIKVQGRLQVMNVLHHLMSSFEPDGMFYFQNAQLDANVPTHFMEMLMDAAETDRESPASVEAFRSYVRMHSRHMIDRKRDLSTGRDVYVNGFRTNVLWSMNGKPSGEANRNGGSEDGSSVQVQFSAELWYPARYLLEILADPDYWVPRHPDYVPGVDDPADGPGDFTFQFNAQRTTIPTVSDGKSLVEKVGFVTEAEGDTDTVPLDDGVLPETALYVMRYNVEKGYDNSLCFGHLLLKDGEELDPALDYEVSYEDRLLTLSQPFRGYPYILAFYADIPKVKERYDLAVAEGFE